MCTARAPWQNLSTRFADCTPYARVLRIDSSYFRQSHLLLHLRGRFARHHRTQPRSPNSPHRTTRHSRTGTHSLSLSVQSCSLFELVQITRTLVPQGWMLATTLEIDEATVTPFLVHLPPVLPLKPVNSPYPNAAIMSETSGGGSLYGSRYDHGQPQVWPPPGNRQKGQPAWACHVHHTLNQLHVACIIRKEQHPSPHCQVRVHDGPCSPPLHPPLLACHFFPPLCDRAPFATPHFFIGPLKGCSAMDIPPSSSRISPYSAL